MPHSSGPFDDYYVAQRSKLLRDFDNFGKYGRKTLVSYYGNDSADSILREARHEFEALIPHIPYVGGKKNILTANLIQSTWALALFCALKRRGKTSEETGKICYEMLEARLYSYPGLIRYIVGRLRFAAELNKMKNGAAESQRRLYPEDWVWSFVEGDGKEFDFGYDMIECAICKFFHTQGADELAPYMCRTDFAVSKALGLGLSRTMTIAEGAEKCDFRFKRGRETKEGWPTSVYA